MTSKRRYETIYELLDEIRPRPAMYIGVGTVSHLQAFLAGVAFSDISEGVPSFWGYNRWITARLGISTSLPWMDLESQLGPAATLTSFFEHLDEYRQCDLVELGTSAGPFHPRFFVGFEREVPPLPVSLSLGQFAPSSVFFLAEVYGQRIEKDFPYCQSADEVKSLAHKRWSVGPDAWLTHVVPRALPDGIHEGR